MDDYALVLSLWMYSNDVGLAATLYSPCEVHARVGDTAVHFSEVTDYPFRGDIRVKVNPETAISFPLRLRIPAWADEPVMLLNGQKVVGAPQAGFAKVDRAWKKEDVVELRLPMTPRVSLAEAPVRLQVKARKLPSWLAVDRVTDPVPSSPVSSNQQEETIALVPYGAAKLRMTAFPGLKS